MTRGNKYKLTQHHCHYDLRKYNFTNRVIPIWNSLPNPSDNTKANFVQFRNKLKSLLRAAEKNYYAEKFTEYKQNLKYTWKLIRSVLNQPVKKETTDCFLKKMVTL